MIYRSREQLLLVWQGCDAIPEAEWTAMVETLRAMREGEIKILVVTHGGAPSPSQQLAVAKLHATRSVTVAVLSDSTGVRFVASAMALFIKRLRTYRLSEMRSAQDFLQLSQAERSFADSFFREVGAAPAVA
jgi:hypothetical protein